MADADYSELLSIGSKPSTRHVFFVDDFDAFKKIEDELITFVCETASASEFFEMCAYSCCFKAATFHTKSTNESHLDLMKEHGLAELFVMQTLFYVFEHLEVDPPSPRLRVVGGERLSLIR